jgi:hypothetical protein
MTQFHARCHVGRFGHTRSAACRHDEGECPLCIPVVEMSIEVEGEDGAEFYRQWCQSKGGGILVEVPDGG